MPIYVFDCPECGPFELNMPLSKSEQKRAKCACGRFGSRAASLTTMRPDKYWSGVIDKDYGYVTSEKQIKDEMKARGHVLATRDEAKKMVEAGIKAREEAAKQRIRKWSRKTFGPEGLGIAGADGEKFGNGKP